MTIQELFKIGMKRDIPLLMEDAKGGIILNLGAGNQSIDGATAFDWPDWDAEHGFIPCPDNSVSQIHAYHFFEHLRDPRIILAECQRVLKKSGHINIVVPYYKSNMAFQDLDHKSFFTEDTWKNLFSKEYYSKGKIDWEFKIGLNIIIGINERNLCLMTQLIKE
jgi:ubiquinone/menaquinone biosynthesis C-methylase UbiE